MAFLFSNKYLRYQHRSENSIRKSIQFALSPNDFSIKLSPTKNLPVPYQIDEEAEPAARQPKVGWLHHQLPRRIGMRLDIQPPGFRLPPAFPFQFRQTTWTNVHQWSTVLFHLSNSPTFSQYFSFSPKINNGINNIISVIIFSI